MIIVAVNGQAGSGKTYLLNVVEQALRSVKKDLQILRMGFKDPIRTALFAHVGQYIDASIPNNDKGYAEAKELDVGGITGRMFMIAMGNALRETDAFFLPRLLLVRANNVKMQLPQVVLIDDLGFPPELQGLMGAPNVDLIPVYTEAHAVENGGHVYAHGERFDSDSRICLRGDCAYIDPDPATLVEAILNKAGIGSAQ